MPLLWAQSLDNMSPDQIRDEDGRLTREEVITAISNVAARGEKVFSNGGIELTVCGDLVIVEMISGRDNVGRLAPVICMGKFRDDDGESVQRSLQNFAHEIGRGASPRQYKIIAAAFEQIKKKRSLAKAVATIVIVLILLAIAIAYSRGSERCSKTGSDTTASCANAYP